jgi:hypothetical protein
MAGNDDILLRIGADVSDLKRGLLEARKETTDTGKVMDDLKGKLLGVAGVLGLGLGFTKLVGDAVQFADAVQKAADQTGMAAEDLQFLRYAADQTGASVEGMTSLVGKMQTQLVEAAKGNKDVAKAVADLGLNLGELRALSPDQQFAAIATEIAKIKDPGEQAAMAVELFGKSGKEALPLIKSFAEGQEELRANFESMGGPVSADAIKAVDDMGDAASTTALGIKAAVVELMAMVAPVITGGLKLVTSLIGAIRGEVEPAADSLEGMNAKLSELYKIQQEGAFRSAGMGLTIGKSPQEMAALQTEIDALKQQILVKQTLLALGDQERVQTAEALEDLVIIDEARRAALEKERLLMEQRRIIMEAERAGELEAHKKHVEEMVNTWIEGSQMATDFEIGELDKSNAYNAASWDQKVGQVAGSLTDMTAGVARENRAMFEINKAAGMASAVVNTAQGVTKALSEYPPPLSFAMAAAQAAAGAAQISAIAKTKFGSGTAPSQAATPATPVANVGASGGGGGGGGDRVLRVQGLSASSIIDGKTTRLIAEQLLEFQKDGGQVVFDQ